MEQILFYFFSWGMLTFGLMVILSRNPVNSAISLVMVFFFMAGLFVLLHAYFLAAVQVLVYAGAIMVLFLFVIMLLNVEEEEKRKMNWFGIIGSIIIVGGLLSEFGYIFFVRTYKTPLVEDLTGITDLNGTTEEVGKLLFSRYLLPFEVASLILLAAMIGVIILTKKEKA